MEAAKLAVLQKPRPLAQSFFVLALDGVVHAGERVLLDGGIYGEVCAFAPDLRAVPAKAWEHFSASDLHSLQVHSAGMVQLRRLEVVGLVDRVDDEDTRKLAKGMLEVAPNFDHAALWWVPVESIEAVVIKLSFVGFPRPCFTLPSLELCRLELRVCMLTYCGSNSRISIAANAGANRFIVIHNLWDDVTSLDLTVKPKLTQRLLFAAATGSFDLCPPGAFFRLPS